MNFEEELTRVLEYYAIVEEKKLQKGINKDYNCDEYSVLKKLINRNFSPYIENVHLNAKVLVDNMGQLLKFTSSNNIDWTDNSSIYLIPNFINILASNLHYFPYENKLGKLLIRMSEKSGLYEEFFKPNLIKSFIFADRNPNAYKSYSPFFNKLNKEQKLFFLNILIENHIRFDFTDFEFDLNDIETKKFIETNIYKILPLLISSSLDFIKIFKHKESIINKTNVYYLNNKNELIESIINHPCLDEFNDSIKELLDLIIRDIAHNENALASDFQWKKSGSYCKVLAIKDKVLKVGFTRMTKTFPNNPLIIKPLLRKTVTLNNQSVFIEVTERANTDEYFSDKDIFEVYKALRKLGLICIDLASNNIGRLEKDNKIYWNGNFESSDEILELEPYIYGEELLADNLVIIDADGIFREDDERLDEYKYRVWNTLEARYQNYIKENKLSESILLKK